MADGAEEHLVARKEVMKCEEEIQSIKAALRRLGTSEQDADPNSLEIVMLKVEGLPDGAKPNVVLQLSSPIEEATLSELYDPENEESAPEGSVATFKGVETTNATLVVSAKDLDIPLGSSAPHEVAPLCVLDAMNIKDKYVSELPVAIMSESEPTPAATTSTTPAEEESKPEEAEKKDETAEVTEVTEEAKPDDDAAAATEGEAVAEAVAEGSEEKPAEESEAKPEEKTEEKTEVAPAAETIVPICTITFRVTYKPSPKDQREELYELLNKTSQRKASALEKLRKISMTMTRSGDSPTKPSSSAMTKPSVKPGFLNKKKKEPTRMQRLYEKALGPNSPLRKALGVVVFGKNYIIFFGAISFFHFKGQMLALPPPV